MAFSVDVNIGADLPYLPGHPTFGQILQQSLDHGFRPLNTNKVALDMR